MLSKFSKDSLLAFATILSLIRSKADGFCKILKLIKKEQAVNNIGNIVFKYTAHFLSCDEANKIG